MAQTPSRWAATRKRLEQASGQSPGVRSRLAASSDSNELKEVPLRKFIIERELPEVGSMEREQLKSAAAKSNEALAQLAPDIQWVESYVAADKTFCVYLAKDEAVIRKHAEISGFPANKITEIRRTIDPTTATGS
jgi:hypothetical protein